MKVRFASEARAEAREARDWFAERDPRTVHRFRERLAQVVAHLRDHPGLGTPYQHGTRRLSLGPFPYYVIYVVNDSSVVVIAVAHAKQRPGYWLGRGPT